MGFSSMIKTLLDRGILDAVKDAVKLDAVKSNPASTAIPNPTPSVAAKEQAPASNVGDLYKRLSSRDIEEEKKKGMKKGGTVKSTASKRADGIATKGKTRGKMI